MRVVESAAVPHRATDDEPERYGPPIATAVAPIAAEPAASNDVPPPPPAYRMLLDRTAVLVVGVVAGFAVGMAFGGKAGPANAPAATAPRTGPRTAAIAPAPPAIQPDRSGTIPPAVVARVRRTGVVHVGVFGDSFGIGVWDALYRTLPKDRGYEVLRFGKEATGFTRYHALDLNARARTQLAADPIDVAVICFGANDIEPFYADGHLQPLMSEGWKRIVGERIKAFVATARSTGATVFWVGLPVMRDAELDASVQAMNAFYAQQTAALGVPFIDTRPLSVDAKGQYNAYLPYGKSGQPRLMRMGDGLHMIGIGYQRITAGLLDRIERYAGRVRTAAGLPPTVEPRP